MASFLHVDLQIAAIGKRRTVIIFAIMIVLNKKKCVVKYRKLLLNPDFHLSNT